MKAKLFITMLLLCIMNIAAFSQFDKLNSFEEVDSLSMVYYKADKIDSSIVLFEYARVRFPEKDEEATLILSYLYNHTKQDDKLLETWGYGLKKRYFFGITDWQYERFKDNVKYKQLLAIDRQLADSLNKLAHMKYEVVLPTDYSIDKTYPTLFIFHGNNRNMEQAKPIWTSDIMHDKFITVYLQGCIHMRKSTYQWYVYDEKTNKEFKVIHDNILEQYRVDKNKVVFLGMSAGGRQAIEYAFNEFVPVSDVLLNCPVIPDLTDSVINAFVNKNKKIVMITGENDWALHDQKNLLQKIDSLGGKSKLTINEELGHQFSEDFSNQLDEYLNWILE